MVTAASLKDQLEAKVSEIEQIVSGISEDKASKAPADGEWCVREVLSHLSGQETQSFEAGLKRFVNEDMPDLGLTPGQPYLTEPRKNAPAQQLLSGVTKQYRDIGKWVSGLSDEQLSRQAHIPFLKDTPFGENPTLSQWVGLIINYHLPQHIEQLQILCK